MVALHERYLACCDDRRLDELGEFVSEHVSGSAPVNGRSGTSSAVAPTGRPSRCRNWSSTGSSIAGSPTAGDLCPVARDVLTAP
jgi:hypothetical protein